MIDTLIRNGLVVSEGLQVRGDLGLDDGKVVGIWSGTDAPDAEETIDATDTIVMPGGIDAHFHTQTGAGYFASRADNMESATVSAAHGGMTTVMPYVWGDRGVPIETYLGSFFDLADSLSVCDYSPHCGIRPDMGLIAQIPLAFDLGVTSFKMQFAYRKTGDGRMSDDDHKLAALQLIGRQGGLGMFHCENGYIIDHLENELIKAGKTSPEYYLPSRPAIAEAEAIHRAIVLGQLADCPVYVVHLSSKEGLHEVVTAQAAGLSVSTETCPQYLTLTDSALGTWGPLAKVGPPLRETADNEAMWSGLESGHIETIGSDHSAPTKEYALSGGDNIFAAVGGTPIVEVMLPLVYSEGVAKGRMTLDTFVAAFTANPARRFGMHPKKGTLQPGADADVLIFDPAKEWVVRAKDLSNPCGFNVYEDWHIQGKPRRSWLRGHPLLIDDAVVAAPGSGARLRRPV